MILHGKDLIVSIDGNANMASKSCTLNVSAKSIVKTSPTSGDWEEVLSGKKSWSLTTNHLVKEATAQSFDLVDDPENFYISNNPDKGWELRGSRTRLTPPLSIDTIGVEEGLYLLEVRPAMSVQKTSKFNRDAMYNGLSLYQYLQGEGSIGGSYIDPSSMIIILPVGKFVLNSDTCNILSTLYHIALPCVEFGFSPVIGTKTYDTTPIILVGGRTGVLNHGYTALDSTGNEINFTLYGGVQIPNPDGIPGAIEMVGKTVTISMTDNEGSRWVGQAIVKQFKVTGSKGNLMAGSFSFTGNSELQTDSKKYNVKPNMVNKLADRIIIDMNKSNPSEMITGDIGENATILNRILKNAHRYLCKYQGNGVMAMCQLADDATDRFLTGDWADIYGEQGDVYMSIAQFNSSGVYQGFYYNIMDAGNNKIVFSVSDRYLGTGWKEWKTSNLIAAFKAQGTSSFDNNVESHDINTGYLRSIYAERAAISDTCQHLQIMIEGMNQDYFGFVGPEEHTIIGLLYLMKYGNPNSQARCGQGAQAGAYTGTTRNLGMHDSEAILGANAVNIFGLENWWGDKAEWMGRLYVRGGTWYIQPRQGSTVTVASSANGMIKNMTFIPDVPCMVPTDAEYSNNYQQGFCDAVEWVNNNVDKFALRGGIGSTPGAGLFALNVKENPSTMDQNVTTRLCFRGESVTIYRDPQEFLALTAVAPAK